MIDWKEEISQRLASLKLEPTREAEIVEELAQHLDDRYAELLQSGTPEEEAHSVALEELSESEALQQELRRIQQPLNREPVVLGAERKNMIANLWQDLRYGLRMLRSNPGFTTVAVLSLALGIGVNTAIFTLFYGLAWRPLPVKDPARIVNLYQSFSGDGQYGRRVNGNWTMVSYPEYVNYRDRTHTLSGLVAYAEETFTLSGSEAERVNGQMVSDNYFSVLGGEATLGRTFVENECQTPGACPQVVLSYGFWQRRFGSDPALIGKTLTLNQQPFIIVGVAARNWSGTEMIVPDVWVPLMMSGVVKRSGREQSEAGRDVDFLSLRDFSWLLVVGRLKAGVSLKQAQTDMDMAASQSDQNDQITKNYDRKTVVTVITGTLLNFPEARDLVIPLGVALLAALCLVLVVVCANVSNLLLARAATRQKEIGVRLALGASRGRLIRQLMTESLLLALLGGAGGLIVASSVPAVFLAAIPVDGLYFNLSPDWTVFVYCFLTSLVTSVLFGLAPALQSTRLNVVSMIKAEGANVGQRISGSRLRNMLLITQVAVSFVLLVCAGLLVRSVWRAQSADLGFEAKNVFVLSVELASAGYSAPRAATFNQQLTERMTALLGIETVSLSAVVPFSATRSTSITLEGTQANRQLEAKYNVVSPNYFHTLEIPIIRGRHFSEQEMQAKQPYVVVSQAMAERLWPDQDPIGKRFNSTYEVIGVARDISSTHFGSRDGPFFYAPALSDEQLGLSFLLRTNTNQQSLAGAAREMVRSLDNNVTVSVKRLEDTLARKLQPARFGAQFSSALSLLVLTLVTMGIYGVMAFLVSRRTREIGIRKALGAQPSDVLKLVLRQAITPVAIGLLIGLALALALTRLLTGQLYGVSATDPVTFVGIALLLATVALLACWIPARRATRVDPMVALRYE
jgi:predicted permease